ncbi:MAG: accessory factor UbiK family protein [Inquilinaceae bacterium]
MKPDSKFLDDLSRLAAGAMGSIAGARDEVEAQVRQRVERVLLRMDMVTRDEFEAVRAMAVMARQQQEQLAERLAALEAEQTSRSGRAKGAKAAPAGTARAKRAAPRAAKSAAGTKISGTKAKGMTRRRAAPKRTPSPTGEKPQES